MQPALIVLLFVNYHVLPWLWPFLVLILWSSRANISAGKRTRGQMHCPDQEIFQLGPALHDGTPLSWTVKPIGSLMSSCLW
jgi:hypothetical protein